MNAIIRVTEHDEIIVTTEHAWVTIETGLFFTYVTIEDPQHEHDPVRLTLPDMVETER